MNSKFETDKLPNEIGEAPDVERSSVLDFGKSAQLDHGADTQLHRALGSRHLTMIALGSSIGMGFGWGADKAWAGSRDSLAVLLTCVFSMSGSENSGLVACEVQNPRKSVPKSVGSIWLRLSAFSLLGSLMVTISTDPHNASLLGAGGMNASPFVLAYRAADLSPLAYITNAVILVSVLSTGSITIYTTSRTLMGLAHLDMAPKCMAWADKSGRPWYGIVPSVILGGGLAYLNVSQGGATVFNWLSNLVSLFTLFGWGMFCLTNIRMRHAWKVQGRSTDDLPWKSWTWPWGAYWLLSWSILLIILEFYLVVWPYHEKMGAKTFFATYHSVPTIVVLYIGAQIYYRTPPWTDAASIDLDEGRRFYVYDIEEERPKTTFKKIVSFVFG
ncbi:amino acid transporter [Aspergillus affinis]|uniref:amino acid transporter n=1 Tax=Aspergillus affinis TaxID=1070780 RepID=UPI0022FDDC1A|nr:amino acid transporter [Aspergillus affinis]KAI9045463.1 amino acid transporter [Aspergillus affinis]